MVKNPPANTGDAGLILGLGRSPGDRDRNPLQYFLPGKPHGQKRLLGYSPWGNKRFRHNLAAKQQLNILYTTKEENQLKLVDWKITSPGSDLV